MIRRVEVPLRICTRPKDCNSYHLWAGGKMVEHVFEDWGGGKG